MTYSTRDACSKTSRSQEKHLSPAGSAREESSSPFFFIILIKFYAPFRAQIALRKAKEFERKVSYLESKEYTEKFRVSVLISIAPLLPPELRKKFIDGIEELEK